MELVAARARVDAVPVADVGADGGQRPLPLIKRDAEVDRRLEDEALVLLEDAAEHVGRSGSPTPAVSVARLGAGAGAGAAAACAGVAVEPLAGVCAAWASTG